MWQIMGKKCTPENYKKVPLIPCFCGCGELIKSKSIRYSPMKYVKGHCRKYDDPKEYQRVYKAKNSARYIKQRKDRGRRIKRELVIKSGGQCEGCGIKLSDNN